jgi:hypothetical protein
MAQGGDLGKPRLGIEKRSDPGGIAKKQKFHIGPSSQRPASTRNDYFRSMVAAHDVERNSYWLDHGLRNTGPARYGATMDARKIRHGRSASKNHLISAASRSRVAPAGPERETRPAFADRAAVMVDNGISSSFKLFFIVAN